jgi:arsenate reductase (thioredoxin)
MHELPHRFSLFKILGHKCASGFAGAQALLRMLSQEPQPVSSELNRELRPTNKNSKPMVLILCTGNSCRSHMPQGILRAAVGDLVNVQSVGCKPAGYVHPLAIRALAEIGIDISRHRSMNLNEFRAHPVDTVITVCGQADQVCPIFPGQVNRHHWPFDDPAQATSSEAKQMERFRQVRDEIRRVFGALAYGLRDAVRS